MCLECGDSSFCCFWTCFPETGDWEPCYPGGVLCGPHAECEVSGSAFKRTRDVKAQQGEVRVNASGSTPPPRCCQVDMLPPCTVSRAAGVPPPLAAVPARWLAQVPAGRPGLVAALYVPAHGSAVATERESGGQGPGGSQQAAEKGAGASRWGMPGVRSGIRGGGRMRGQELGRRDAEPASWMREGEGLKWPSPTSTGG